MTFELVLAVVFVAAMIFGAIYMIWYNSSEHTTIKDKSKLNHSAKIVAINRESVGRKGAAGIRTTVVFDDGFSYISHMADKKNFGISIQLRVTPEITKRILINAVKAHEEAIEKYK